MWAHGKMSPSLLFTSQFGSQALRVNSSVNDTNPERLSGIFQVLLFQIVRATLCSSQANVEAFHLCEDFLMKELHSSSWLQSSGFLASLWYFLEISIGIFTRFAEYRNNRNNKNLSRELKQSFEKHFHGVPELIKGKISQILEQLNPSAQRSHVYSLNMTNARDVSALILCLFYVEEYLLYLWVTLLSVSQQGNVLPISP